MSGADSYVPYVPSTLLRPIDLSIKFDTSKSGWFIVYTEGSHVKIKKKHISSKIVSVLANSADTDKMNSPPYTTFHLGSHCLP